MIAIVAQGVCSPLGEGDDAFGPLVVGAPPDTRVGRDDELERARLARPFLARAAMDVPEGVDRATALLERALTMCATELDGVLPGWRSLRVGAAIGTSSGGMRSFEEVFTKDEVVTRDRAVAATYFGPVANAARPTPFEPFAFVLGACASSTLAIGLGRTWLAQDRCDIALCGGFDAVSVFVAAGFESLRATCGPKGPQPFRAGRDGLALGEGAAVLALLRDPDRHRVTRVHAWVNGFGATCDAAHLTAPDGQGVGLARAAAFALEEAGLPEIGLVSAHGTATRQNDNAEAKAIVEALEAHGERLLETPVYSLKGAMGHTLGAAGAIEVSSVVSALALGVAPASVGEGPIDGGLRVLDRVATSTARSALKLSSAFGGANAALVIGKEPVELRAEQRDVFVSRGVFVSEADTDAAPLAERTGYAADRLARADLLVRLSIAATAALEDANGGRGMLRNAGIIVGHGLATIETNKRFLDRIALAGASRAEPRRFAYTTPNAAAGECAVAFGLTGPAFAVGGGPHGGIEAIAVAADVVRAGVIDRMVVIAVDEVGPATLRLSPGVPSDKLTSGAVAVLVAAAPLPGSGRLESCTVRLPLPLDAGPLPLSPYFLAHPALKPLAEPNARPDCVEVHAFCGGIARAKFFWL